MIWTDKHLRALAVIKGTMRESNIFKGGEKEATLLATELVETLAKENLIKEED